MPDRAARRLEQIHQAVVMGSEEHLYMRQSKSRLIRNKLDLTDRVQVRVIKKRLKLSGTELKSIIGKTGNSLSAISKEAAIQKGAVLSLSPAPPETIADPTSTERTATETTAVAPAS
jgi:hypothetical protein